MIATVQDLMVYTQEDFENLPEDGKFEVVDGRAVLLPPNDVEPQYLSDDLVVAFREGLRAASSGYVVSTPNVFIPRPADAFGKFQSRVPDLAVSRRKPQRHYEVGNPPDLVIEILATRRGNVERTEKLDDYALAGIGEYWIVNPFQRAVEIYALSEGEYVLESGTPEDILRPRAFPGVEIHMRKIWESMS